MHPTPLRTMNQSHLHVSPTAPEVLMLGESSSSFLFSPCLSSHAFLQPPSCLGHANTTLRGWDESNPLDEGGHLPTFYHFPECVLQAHSMLRLVCSAHPSTLPSPEIKGSWFWLGLPCGVNPLLLPSHPTLAKSSQISSGQSGFSDSRTAHGC